MFAMLLVPGETDQRASDLAQPRALAGCATSPQDVRMEGTSTAVPLQSDSALNINACRGWSALRTVSSVTPHTLDTRPCCTVEWFSCRLRHPTQFNSLRLLWLGDADVRVFRAQR
jgi:hypothetical protein